MSFSNSTLWLSQIFDRFVSPTTNDKRILFLGLDASGRTTLLYRLKLGGEVVTTIPTIGFNVEEISANVPSEKKNSQSSFLGGLGTVKYTIWDAGGCDKIRPLFRHYFQGVDGLIFFIDSNDVDRLPSAVDELAKLCNEEILVQQKTTVGIAWNKIDLENSQSVSMIQGVVEERILSQTDCHLCQLPIVPISATTGEGVDDLLDVLYRLTWTPTNYLKDDDEIVRQRQQQQQHTPQPQEDPEAKIMREKFQFWMERHDEDEETFLQQLRDFTLPSWDHYTHLRIAFVLLRKHGRRDGMALIFRDIRNFIEHSTTTQRSRGTTFHESMTYFWAHMVHFAMASSSITLTQANNSNNDEYNFKAFLAWNPQLSNGGLFLHYYSKELMLQNPESRMQVVLPDKRPLPSMLSDSTKNKNSDTNKPHNNQANTIQLGKPLDDKSFLDAVKNGKSPSGGHEARIRAIWCTLQFSERNQVFPVIEILDGEGYYHLTRTYFWLQMVTLARSKEEKENGSSCSTTFHQFIQSPTNQHLRNPDIIDKFYSQQTLMRGNKEMVLPDKKQIPNVLL